MIDFGNLLEEQAVVQPKKMNKLFQEAKKSEKDDDVDSAVEKYDDRYDLDNGPDVEIEPVDVDVDDDNSDDEKDDDSKKEESDEDDKEKDNKKSSKKKSEKDDEEDIDYDEECGDEVVGESFGQWRTDDKAKAKYKKQLIYFEKQLINLTKSLKKNPNNPTIIDELKDIYQFIQNARQRYLMSLGNPEYDTSEIEKLEQTIHKLLKLNQVSAELIQNMVNLLKLYLKEVNKVKREKKEKQKPVKESWVYQESILRKRQPNQDVDEESESHRSDNNYYTAITQSSKNLEHLYKTLLKRADKTVVLEELTNLFTELKSLREQYFKNRKDVNRSVDPHQSYQGMKRIIDQDIVAIEKNLEKLADPKEKKPNKNLIKKTIKMINNLQQDMITECERSHPFVIRHTRDISKKMWLFENYVEDSDEDEITMEDGEDAIFAKVGEIMIKLRKQKELQELAEKNGVEINGMRYTDDTVMNIATSVIALLLAKNEGDPRYRRLVEQGMQKRSLKVELINSYKEKANDLINRYDHGPIVGAEPYNRDIEIVTDEDTIEEEFYIDETGEMQSSYYQEADEEDEEDTEEPEEDDSDDEEDEEDDEEDEGDDEPEEDDEDEDKDIEEFYVDPITGELKSTWYNEMDKSDMKSTHKSHHIRDDEDDENIWKFKPGKSVGDIEFGMKKEDVHSELKHYSAPKECQDTKDSVSAEDYGQKFIVYYDARDKVEAIEILKDITVEWDHSTIFPGFVTSVENKALDLKPDMNHPENGLVSKIMGIAIIKDPSNKIRSITFARKDHYKDKEFKKFDKVKWHVDNGSDEKDMIRRFKEVYKFLDKHHLLTPSGKDEMKHISIETILTSREVNDRGYEFLVKYYDKCINFGYEQIRAELEKCWLQFNSSYNSKS